MRIGFVGLSGPLFYDYGRPATPGPVDVASSPNPILDSPFGLMLLYDELWFLCRSLCPENMRAAPFVRFLDEDGSLPDLEAIDIEDRLRVVAEDARASGRYKAVARLFNDYGRVVAALGIDWGPLPDNHTHTLRVSGAEVRANSVDLTCLLFDLEVVMQLGPHVELVANSFAQNYLEAVDPRVNELDLAHMLVVERIPNWLSEAGPFHPVVLEAREHRDLKDFRAWIASSTIVSDAATVLEAKAIAEAAIRETERTILRRYFDENRMFQTVGKTLVASTADSIIPFTGAVATIYQGLRDVREAKARRWQGFLIDLDRRG